MQGIAEAIKYLYQQFILRDVVAYVAPGTILAACLLRVHFRGLEPAVLFIQGIPKIAYVAIYGLLFTMGLGIQNFGELIGLVKDHVRKDKDGHLSEELRFDKLQEFHRVVLSSKTPDQPDDYAGWMERTRERIEVKKYASGNIALALVMGAVVILLAKLSWNAGRWSILATGAILAVSLIRANYRQAENVRIWEDGAIKNHQKKNLRFVVNQIRGTAWDASRPIRSQALWDEHAAFMDHLTADGFIVLGGPLGDPEGEAMLVVDAPDEETVQATMAKDPWRHSGHLTVPGIQRWTIFLEAGKERD